MLFALSATSQSIDVQIVDDSGLPVTGLAAATFPTLTYSLAGANADVAFPTLSDLAAITTAYNSGGVKERGNGVYRLDVPNGVFSTAGQVKIRGEATGKHVLCPIVEVQAPVNSAYINAVSTSSVTTINANLGTTQPVNFTGSAGSALVKSDAIDINSVSASSVTTINANLGTTQPVNFTGTAGSALVKSDSIDIGSTAQTGLDLGANWTAARAAHLDADISSRMATFTLPTNFSALGISLGGHILNVDTLTTYTGNTPQTGDAFSRLGAPAGASTAADIAAVKSDTGTILTDVNTGAGAIYTRLGAPAGASLAADIAAVEAHAANIDTQVGTAGAGLTNIGDTRMAHLDRDISAILTTAMTESYAALHSAPTPAQALLLIQQSLHEFAISSTTRTVKKLDGSTTAATFTLDSATTPTSTARAT